MYDGKMSLVFFGNGNSEKMFKPKRNFLKVMK